MRILELIDKKKSNQELSKQEIDWIVKEYTAGNIPDYQMSAFLMAVCFTDFSDEETYNLTVAMRDSGDIIDLSAIKGIKVDKHSSGGVGDKITPILLGVIGALDVPIAKMSGRGLGHTGGTIDKFECIPGFRADLSIDEFIENVNSVGVAIAEQTSDLAPADKKIYALRDVTGTVDSIPLIASSIMSKKLASGSDKIVLDVTVGSGAFMTNLEDARKLATKMVSIGNRFGKETIAVITNMDEPLGLSVGNAVEIAEVVRSLKGYGMPDVMEIVFTLGSYMIMLAGKANNAGEARILMETVISNGSAYNKFLEFVSNQGGDISYVRNYDTLAQPSIIREVQSEESGYVHKINARIIGDSVKILGGGRDNIDDEIDPSVGIVINKKVSEQVKTGQILAFIYGNDKEKVDIAYRNVIDAYEIGAEPIERPKMILDIIK